MLLTHRLNLLTFGVFTGCAGLFTAAETTSLLIAAASPVMAGIGAGLAATALLPGRTARFS